MTTQYVYKLTCKISGKMYIGCRFRKGCHPSELGVDYFTSSDIVAPLFKEDPDRFHVDIILSDDSRQLEYDMLSSISKEQHHMYFNRRFSMKAFSSESIVKGNKNPDRWTDEARYKAGSANRGKKQTKESSEKKSLALKGKKKSEAWKLKISESMKGNKNGKYGRKGKPRSVGVSSPRTL